MNLYVKKIEINLLQTRNKIKAMHLKKNQIL